MRLERFLLGGALAVAAPLAAAWLAGLRVNLTDSIPRGLYRVLRSDGDVTNLRRGDIVLVCLSRDVAVLARKRGYVPGGGSCASRATPLGKVVLAVPGDTVVVTAAGLAVNGWPVANSAPLTRDRAGLALPRLVDGRYVVRVGELWLGSCSPRGFDSRYYGAVLASGVRSRLAPAWIVCQSASVCGATITNVGPS